MKTWRGCPSSSPPPSPCCCPCPPAARRPRCTAPETERSRFPASSRCSHCVFICHLLDAILCFIFHVTSQLVIFGIFHCLSDVLFVLIELFSPREHSETQDLSISVLKSSRKEYILTSWDVLGMEMMLSDQICIIESFVPPDYPTQHLLDWDFARHDFPTTLKTLSLPPGTNCQLASSA